MRALGWRRWLTVAAKAMHLETRRLESLVWVVIMPNFAEEMKVERSPIFSVREGSSLFFAVYGSAGLPPVLVLEKSDIADSVLTCWMYSWSLRDLVAFRQDIWAGRRMRKSSKGVRKGVGTPNGQKGIV
jgi:hypothetical protein